MQMSIILVKFSNALKLVDKINMADRVYDDDKSHISQSKICQC